MRELLVIKHIGALPELFLNGDKVTYKLMEDIINVLALIQKNVGLTEPRSRVNHGVLMNVDEQTFAQWLLGVSIKVN